ncbi:MAG TPA: serine hydrolase domain-containing protein [Terracidiphilus sp.]|nr:serine hydrolase domain-containing protein [Terracidiphilus sp.]
MDGRKESDGPASAAQRSRFSGVYRVLEEAIAARAFPGCGFGVLAEGEPVLLDALGRFTYEDDAPAVTPTTRFDMASLTKVVATTALAMLLVQRGQMELDTPLGEVLPGFVVGRDPAEGARRVTLRHLLAHSSGLPGYVELFKHHATPAPLLRACLALKLEAEPGTRAEYSDPGFMLLGKAIEVLARERLDGLARREIFAPLGMTATGFRPAAHLRASIPPTEEDRAFRRRRIQGEVQDENAWAMGGVSGHAGLFSNAGDLLRYMAAILQVGTGDSGTEPGPTVFQAATVEMFAQRQGPAGSSRAIGWDTPSENSSAGRRFSAHSIGHLGYSGCSLWIDLDARVAAVLLTNRTWPDRASQLIRQVRPAYHDAVREAL